MIMGCGTRRWLPRELRGLLTRLDSIGVGFGVLYVLWVYKLGGRTMEVTKGKYILVSRT
jgi:hypothetical protein